MYYAARRWRAGQHQEGSKKVNTFGFGQINPLKRHEGGIFILIEFTVRNSLSTLSRFRARRRHCYEYSDIDALVTILDRYHRYSYYNWQFKMITRHINNIITIINRLAMTKKRTTFCKQSPREIRAMEFIWSGESDCR